METALTTKTPQEMILQAVQNNADLDKLEKLLELQIKWEQNEAKKAYHKAMAEFKANPPDIEKDKHVNFGQGKASYSHASLANVCKKVNSELSKHGLSASWVTTQNNGSVSVTCKITHEMGHSESTTLTASPDISGNKNAIQAIGSTISYLERYTLLALVGLATTDMDDDGEKSEAKPISDKQAKEINKLLQESGADEIKFMTYFEVERINDIKENQYKEAVKFLKAKIANKYK